MYVTSHLMNLSLGLISIDAMDVARPYLTGVWTGPYIGALLTLSLIVHFGLGLWAIYKRPTLRTSLQDIVQLATGLLVVPLLATHAIGISMLNDFGVEFSYAQNIKLFWLSQPTLGLTQVVMLAVVWVHGCAGLFTWLRSKESARDVLGWLYPLAVAVPVVALLGYAEAGRAVIAAANAPQVEQAYEAPAQADPDASYTSEPAPVVDYALIKTVTKYVIWTSIVLGFLTLLARWLRVSLIRSERVMLLRDNVGPMPSNSAQTMLDGFRQNQQSHASLCEGRGRCGTCAVRILRSEFPLPPPSPLEARTLLRIKAPENARLACQLMPAGGRVETAPMYPADYSFHDDKPAEATPTKEVQL
jgi:adenylate cyclase